MTERTIIMGMSASQARFLCLTARKNNVEFEGQQINQQRTSLSNESGSYYSELCNLVVPTPPSIDDYTKVSYTFDDGALTNTITSMIAKGGNEYSISYIQQWQDDYSIVSSATSVVSRANKGTAEEPSYEYSIGSAVLRKMNGTFAGNITTEDIQNMSEEEFEDFQNTDAVKKDKYLSTLTQDQFVDLIAQESYYKAMLNEKNGTNEDYYVRYLKDSQTGGYVPYFYKENEIENPDNYLEDNLSAGLSCYTIGSATKTKEVLNKSGSVEKDSTGRYLSITLYDEDENGERINPITYNLTTKTSTDDAAYNDAMNKYNYEQHQYNQKVQEINSKIEVIQQQDKSLELKLKQLDTEQNAISQEMEAVKKVIQKNVETTFKTFNA